MDDNCKICIHDPLCIFKEEYNKVLSEIAIIKEVHSKNLYTTDTKCTYFYKQVSNPRICGGGNI